MDGRTTEFCFKRTSFESVELNVQKTRLRGVYSEEIEFPTFFNEWIDICFVIGVLYTFWQ